MGCNLTEAQIVFDASIWDRNLTNGIFVKNGGAVDIGLYNFTYDASAILQTVSTTKGFLRPVMTQTQRDAISTPANGLSVYNSTTNANNFYNSSAWVRDATWGYIAKTANYTALTTDYTIDCTSGTFTVTLPTAVGSPGRVYIITNSGAGTITIATTSSQTFTNITATPTTLTMAALGTYQVQSTGANWVVVSKL